jgi:hypothetical protein
MPSMRQYPKLKAGHTLYHGHAAILIGRDSLLGGESATLRWFYRAKDVCTYTVSAATFLTLLDTLYDSFIQLLIGS